MKRLFFLASVILVTALGLALLRARERVTLASSATLLDQRAQVSNQIAKQRDEQASLRQTLLAQKARRSPAARQEQLSPAFVAWLLKGDFTQIPDSLVPELRSALNLSPNLSPDFVLISKSSLRTLAPPSPGRDDKLADSLCALLSLSPEQGRQIQAALSEARGQFGEWARQNLQREGPQGDTLVRYIVPAAPQFADSVTNQLLSAIGNLIGDQRAGLFWCFDETWFQIQTGYLGGVTNTLSVLRRPGSDGQPALFYHLTREGAQTSLGEGPSQIQPQFFPPAWRNVFPGGWPELAQREGFELPQSPAKDGNTQ